MEVSIYGYCSVSCSFCFANRNRDAFERELNTVNSAPGLFRKLERCLQDEYSPIGFFLRERYPICFSNTVDPFLRQEKQYRATEAFLQWAKANRIPLYVQTRGNVLLEEWERYAPLLVPGKDMVYLSICQLDDKIRKHHEPGAQSLDKRWELARRLTEHGIPVVAACNPYVKEWVPDPDAYCRHCVEAGVKGIWLESLHFTAAQGEQVADVYRPLLMQANLLPMFVVAVLKGWYAATEQHGLDFFPSPRWDAYFGHRARHPECADPAWLGGKTLDFNFRLLKAIHRLAEREGPRVCFGWQEIRSGLESLRVPNPLLDTGPFWYAYNNQQKGDYRAWKAGLGNRASFHEVLRYFWNHPWEKQAFLWYHPLVKIVWKPDTRLCAVDDAGDCLGILDLKTNRHHGPKEIDYAALDWERAVWPRFEPAPFPK